MQKAMSDDLKTRYRDENVKMMLNIAAFLDPRFRELDFLKEAEERKKVKTEVKKRMVDLEKKYLIVKREPGILPSQNTDEPLPSTSSPMDDLNATKKAKVETDSLQSSFLTLFSQMLNHHHQQWKEQKKKCSCISVFLQLLEKVVN